MRKLILGLLCVLFVSTVAAQVTRYEMLFEAKQIQLTNDQKLKIDTLAQVIKFGERLMIYPLTKDYITDQLIFAREARQQAIEIANYSKSIGFELLGTPMNFPSAYRGLSICANMKFTKPKEEIIIAQGLQGHYPPKESQFFMIDPTKDTLIVGNEGTELFFKAGCLTTKKKVKVELKEFYDIADYMKNGLPTVSNGQMIETGGSIYLDATEENDGSKKVSINPDIGVDVGFTIGQSDTNMQIFIKDPRSPNKLNWILPPKSIVTKKWRMTETIKDQDGNIISQKTFNSEKEWEAYEAEQKRLAAIEAKKREEERIKEEKRQEEEKRKWEAEMLKREKEARERERITNKLTVLDMGYINCDKFYNEPMLPFIAVADTKIQAEYYLVFKDVRGVMSGSVTNNGVIFGRVPENRQAVLIAVAFVKNQAYYYESEINVNNSVKPVVSLNPVEESFLDQQLAMLK